MARRLRIKIPGHAAGYHVTSRVRGREFRLNRHMKQYVLSMLIRLKRLYYVELAAFTVMDNHYHLLVQFADPEDIDPRKAIERWNKYHRDTPYCRNELVAQDRQYVVREMTDVSSFMKRLNLHLTREYNRGTHETGALWESRFRSVVVERGWALVNCAAYIELNGFRASLVSAPERYEFGSLRHLKRGNLCDLVNVVLLDEGLGVGGGTKAGSGRKAYEEEVYGAYRAFVYEAGTTPKRDQYGIGERSGVVVTSAMRKRLARHRLSTEAGVFLSRAPLYARGKLTAGSEYALRFYEQHINPGYSGKARDRHRAKWVHAITNGLYAVTYCGPSWDPSWGRMNRGRNSSDPAAGSSRAGP